MLQEKEELCKIKKVPAAKRNRNFQKSHKFGAETARFARAGTNCCRNLFYLHVRKKLRHCSVFAHSLSKPLSRFFLFTRSRFPAPLLGNRSLILEKDFFFLGFGFAFCIGYTADFVCLHIWAVITVIF